MPGETHADSQASITRALVGRAIGAAVVLCGLVFVLALRLDWTLGWIYVGILAANWDKVWLGLFAPVAIAVYVVALLKARDAVSNAPGAAWLLGLAIFVPSWALVIWSMVVNPFFEKTVRIQKDRGHHVIDTGPYAYVRHPGYVGFAGWMLSTPLLLASSWAFVPALLAVVALVIRTALEDRTLHAELPGYPEYAARVRFRLIPGIW